MDFGDAAFKLGKSRFGRPHFRQGGGVAFGAGGGPRASSGAAILSWDNSTNSNVLIQWDDASGNPQYLEWDV